MRKIGQAEMEANSEQLLAFRIQKMKEEHGKRMARLSRAEAKRLLANK